MFLTPRVIRCDASSISRSSAGRSIASLREKRPNEVVKPNYRRTERSRTPAQDVALAQDSGKHGTENESSRTSMIARNNCNVNIGAALLPGLNAGVSARTF
jgi:hypothetical protein